MDEEHQLDLATGLLRYYQFAYCLIPDDLQAAQLVIDSHAKSKVLKGLKPEKSLTREEGLLLIIIELGKSRLDHSLSSYQELETEDFFKLPVETRIILWAVHRMGFSCRQIGLWLELEEFTIYNQLLVGERRLLRNSNGEHLEAGIFESIKECPQSSSLLMRMRSKAVEADLIHHLELCDSCQKVNSLYRKKEAFILDKLPVIRFDDDLRSHMEFEIGLFTRREAVRPSDSKWDKIGQFFSRFAVGKRTKNSLRSPE